MIAIAGGILIVLLILAGVYLSLLVMATDPGTGAFLLVAIAGVTLWIIF